MLDALVTLRVSLIAYSGSMNIPQCEIPGAATSLEARDRGQAKGDKLMRRIRVKSISVATIVITVVLGAICATTLVVGWSQFQALRNANEAYIECAADANQLQSASDYLTEQVRLAAMTGDEKYVDAYFDEANNARRREEALENLGKRLLDADALNALQAAMDESNSLMLTEFYAMRLIEQANGCADATSHDELRTIDLESADASLTSAEMLARARDLVSNEAYENARSSIQQQTGECLAKISTTTDNHQNHATSVFEDVYRKLVLFVASFALFSLAACVLIRTSIVTPIAKFNERICENEPFPVMGAGELQVLAETYNQVREENESAQMLIRHQAEHDALTDLLNRGSYEKILSLYESGERPFALILVDVDVFKQVNDTYGHACGDAILKRVATLLKTTFRSIDHACRIGGDEFAVIMVEMTPDLRYTIEEKIEAINEQLEEPEDGLPKVSLSVGVAFTERKNPSESLYKDADSALYHTKENGRCGCTFYGDF